jgi:hypothetical protein
VRHRSLVTTQLFKLANCIYSTPPKMFERGAHHAHNRHQHPSMAAKASFVARSGDVVNFHFDDPTFSDLTIKLSDRVVHVHQVVLCRGSQYFTSLLAGKFMVGSHLRLTIRYKYTMLTTGAVNQLKANRAP